MDEYIDRGTAIAKLNALEVIEPNATMVDARRLLADMPAADVAPVVHGRWIHDGRRIEGGIDWCHCSECGKSGNFCARTNYYPNCGAKMDGDADYEAD